MANYQATTEMTCHEGSVAFDEFGEHEYAPPSRQLRGYTSQHHRGERWAARDSDDEEQDQGESSSDTVSEAEEDIAMTKEQERLFAKAQYTDASIGEKTMQEFILFGDIFLRVLPHLEREEHQD